MRNSKMLNKILGVLLVLFVFQQNIFSQENKENFADKVNIIIWTDGIFIENNFVITENEMYYTRPYSEEEKEKSILRKLNILKNRKIKLDNDTARMCIAYSKDLFFKQEKGVIKKILFDGQFYDIPVVKITYYKNGKIVSEKEFQHSKKMAEYDENFEIMYKYFWTIIRKEFRYVWSLHKS